MKSSTPPQHPLLRYRLPMMSKISVWCNFAPHLSPHPPKPRPLQEESEKFFAVIRQLFGSSSVALRNFRVRKHLGS